MSRRRCYKFPPIKEALCEFRFEPESDWDVGIPEKLNSILGNEYSGKRREQRVMKFGLNVNEGKPGDLQYDQGLARIHFVTDDETRMVGVGKNVLSIHMLRPYQDSINPEQGGWNEFSPRIKTALNAYHAVAKPKGVIRIGVRYINEIVIPLAETLRVEEYLKCAQLELEDLPETYVNFISRVEYRYDDDVRLFLSYGLLNVSSDYIKCLLDLDVVWQDKTPVELEKSLEIVRDMHEREGSAFEAVITDKTRELFDVS